MVLGEGSTKTRIKKKEHSNPLTKHEGKTHSLMEPLSVVRYVMSCLIKIFLQSKCVHTRHFDYRSFFPYRYVCLLPY